MEMLDDVLDTSEIWEKVIKNLRDKIGGGILEDLDF